jgi:antitoxin CptB
MAETSPSIESVKRLRWACRRGLLELDALLQRFCVERLSDLSSIEQAHFAELLQYSDPELLSFIMGDATVTVAHLTPIVASLKTLTRDSYV